MKLTSLAISVLLASCAVPSTRVAISLPPKPATEVVVIRALPSKPYRVVAEFQGVGLSESRIRTIGGKLGADAVYVASYNISFPAGDATVTQPGMRENGMNSESLCTAITYR